jgi:Ca2+-binding RTX toxin-like protein
LRCVSKVVHYNREILVPNANPTLSQIDVLEQGFNPNTEIELDWNALRYDNSDAADSDGDITAFVVLAVNSGSLRIGSDAATATPWDAATNASFGNGPRAFWTPAANAQGTLPAITVVAQDNELATSSTPVLVQVSVLPNQAPTINFIDISDFAFPPNAEVAVNFGTLNVHSDARDPDGSVQAFVVTEVTSGTLRIGNSAATATAWDATLNNVIDASHGAYWRPALNASGSLNAFKVLARDDELTTSSQPVPVQFEVMAINGAPTLGAVNLHDMTLAVNTEVALTFGTLFGNSDANDSDGSVRAFEVADVTSGTLRIGSSAIRATEWDPVRNHVIDSTHHAYWTPDTNAHGTINAFTVVARDNDQTTSLTPVQVQLTVENQLPTLTSVEPLAFNPVSAGELEMALPFELIALHAEAEDPDVEGEVTAWDVAAVGQGTLRIGQSAQTATPWDALTNHVIDASHTAFWTHPDGTTSSVPAITLRAIDNLGGVSAAAVTLAIEVPYAMPPTMSKIALPVANAVVGVAREVSAEQILDNSDAADRYGHVDALVVKAVLSGSLRIGATEAEATPWAALTNDVIGPDLYAYWTPDGSGLGQQQAFTVVARDDSLLTSEQPVAVNVDVRPAGPPLPVAFGSMAMTARQSADGHTHYMALHAMIDDARLGQLDRGHGNYSGAVVTVQQVGDAAPGSVFGGVGPLVLDGASVVVEGVLIGTAAHGTGSLAITFNGQATQERVNAALSNITFLPSSTASGDVQLQWAYVPKAGASPVLASSVIHVEGTSPLVKEGDWRNDLISLPEDVAGWLRGGMGVDSLFGGDRDDRLDGGYGKDLMAGGQGNDIYMVDSSMDRLREDADGGDDTVMTDWPVKSFNLGANIENLVVSGLLKFSGKGNELNNRMSVATTGSNVTFDGAAGDDLLMGGDGADALTGGLGQDTLLGGQGINNLKGGLGDDWIHAGAGGDKIDGGDGQDTIYAGEGANAVKGGLGHDLITANEGGDKIDAGDGHDTVFAGDGSNYVKGGTGDDHLHAGAGADTIDGGEGADHVYAGDGSNVLKGGLGDDHIEAGAGNDTIDGGDGNDHIDAGFGTNLIKGGNGDDVLINASGTGSKLDGGKGNDLLHAMANTILIGGAGADTFLFDQLPLAGQANTINDFNVTDDTIQLDHLVFTAVGSAGPLLASAFRLGAEAITAEQRIIVDATRRTVSYDDDGSGIHSAVVIANLVGNLSNLSRLTEADFQII